MTAPKKGKIYVGIGGWTFEPWRGSFYPDGLAHRRELEYASSKLGAIEINGTYYGSQKPESFARWHDETPRDFVFALKGPRFTTNRRILGEAAASVERFFDSGVLLLREKLGPINWQFMPTKKFDPEDLEAFLELLPRSLEGKRIRHAVEVRHRSFAVPAAVELARRYDVAIVVGADSDYPQINDPTSDFVYVRAMGTRESETAGYAPSELDRWAKRAQEWAGGGGEAGLPLLQPAPNGGPRDVFLFIIGGFKERNPLAAQELLARLADRAPA